MAGAPSARGCEACRKQKKKCDQTRPACSRCTRLKLKCIGAGQRRFIFKQAHQDGSSASSSRSLPEHHAIAVARSPSDESMRRGIALITLLEVTDVRYALNNYGDFFSDIPKRLGRHRALDAAIDSIIVSYAGYRNGQRSSASIAKYSKAIQALNTCLEDPSMAFGPETLCAIYLCMICEGWLVEADEVRAHHGEAMALIMNTALRHPWRPGFEADILNVMCMPVVLESLFNPKINLGPWIWRLIEIYEPMRTSGPRRATPFESLHMRNLVNFAVLFRSPELHMIEIYSSYQQMCHDLRELRKGLEKVRSATIAIRSTKYTTETLHAATTSLARIQTAYSLLLTLATMFNGILSRWDLEHKLKEESESHCSEIIRTAEQASEHRPFGSSAQPLALITAWVLSNSTETKRQAKQLLSEYQSDFPGTDWVQLAGFLEQKFLV